MCPEKTTTVPGKRTTILVLGETGTGKSTLLNNILGDESFKIDDDGVHSVTSETSLATIIENNREINAIDSQGFNDSSGNDAQNIDQMVSFLQNYEKGVNLIIITINANNCRLSEQTKIILKKIYQMFGTEKIFEHICIVYTSFYFDHHDDSDKKKLFNYTKTICQEFKEIANITDVPAIPSYFIDSKPKKEDPSSSEQKESLVELAFKKNCLPTTSVFRIDPNIKEKIPEIRQHYIIDQKRENNITSTIYADQTRNKTVYWNGAISYDDWVDLNYEIINRRQKTQRRTECHYHDSHSVFGFSSKPHTHYNTYIRIFDVQQVIKMDKNHKIISTSNWDMVDGTLREQHESHGEEHGHSRQEGVVDID